MFSHRCDESQFTLKTINLPCLFRLGITIDHVLEIFNMLVLQILLSMVLISYLGCVVQRISEFQHIASEVLLENVNAASVRHQLECRPGVSVERHVFDEPNIQGLLAIGNQMTLYRVRLRVRAVWVKGWEGAILINNI